MHQIRYKVKIKYTDFDNQTYTVEYKIFANDTNDAKNIAQEMFFMSYGTFNDMKINVKPIEPSAKVKNEIKEILQQSFGVVKSKFTTNSYKSFLDFFLQFDGYNLVLKPNYASFWFRLMNLECQAIWNEGISYISDAEIVIHLDDNRTYVVYNKLMNIFIAY